MQARNDKPEPVTYSNRASSGGGGGFTMMKGILLIVVAVIISIFAVNLFFLNGYVKISDDKVNMQGMSDTIVKTKTDLTTAMAGIQNTMNSLPTTLQTQVTTQVAQATKPMGDQITAMQRQVDGINNLARDAAKTSDLNVVNNSINTLSGKIDALNTQLTSLKAQLTADETNISILSGNITTLATKIATGTATGTGSGTSTGTSSIPNVTITAGVTDEGSIQTDNSTLGEIRLTFVNTGTAVDDVVLSVNVFFSDCASANQAIVSATYGTWSVRSRSVDQVELRGKLSRLYANQTKKIYIDLSSLGILQTGGSRITTTLDISSSDVEVIDWSLPA